MTNSRSAERSPTAFRRATRSESRTTSPPLTQPRAVRRRRSSCTSANPAERRSPAARARERRLGCTTVRRAVLDGCNRPSRTRTPRSWSSRARSTCRDPRRSAGRGTARRGTPPTRDRTQRIEASRGGRAPRAAARARLPPSIWRARGRPSPVAGCARARRHIAGARRRPARRPRSPMLGPHAGAA